MGELPIGARPRGFYGRGVTLALRAQNQGADMHTRPASRLSITLLALAAGTLALSACDRNDGRTAGQQMDQTVAKVERKSDEVVADVREAGRDAKRAAGQATDAVANKSRDMAITAEVNARLARDPELSALAINVDTADGRVVLRGSAPDLAARGRAAQLASGIDGVVSVNNELSVQRR
jgi:hypothetical protein